jgi:hypothetical protein
MENNKYLGIPEHDMPDLIMLTYPRSGRHWLYWNLSTNTDLKINFFHCIDQGIGKEYYKNNISVPIMTVIRSPEECMASINAMEENTQTEQRIKEYVDHYAFILEHADLFFSYEDLREKTPEIIKFICDRFGGRILGSNDNFQDYERWYKETQNPLKLITSKTSDLYKNSLAYINSIDLSKHEELYAAALNKCIKL